MTYEKQIVTGPNRLASWIARKVLFFWTRATVLPEDISQLGIDPEKPIFYVLEEESVANRMILDRYTRKNGLPRPVARISLGANVSISAHAFMRRFDGFFNRPSKQAVPTSFVILMENLDLARVQGLQVVPVNVFWGRSPDKEKSAFRLLFAETWERLGFLRRFIRTIVYADKFYCNLASPLN